MDGHDPDPSAGEPLWRVLHERTPWLVLLAILVVGGLAAFWVLSRAG